MGEKDERSLLLSLAHFVMVAVIAVGVEEILKGQIHEHMVFTGALLIVMVQILLFYLIFKISGRLNDIAPRIGVKTNLFDFPEAYKEAEKIVTNAKEEVLVVSNMALPFQFNPAAEADRKTYFSMLLEEAARNHDLTYQRIVQLAPTPIENKKNFSVLLPHLRECIQKRDKKEGAIGVFSCPLSVLVSFLMVDSTWIVLQLDEFDNTTRRYQVGKAIILEDRTKKLTPIFKKLFRDMMFISHSMTLAELNEIEHAHE